MKDEGKKKRKEEEYREMKGRIKERKKSRLYFCILRLIRSVVLNHQGSQHKTRGGSSGYLKTEEGGEGCTCTP